MHLMVFIYFENPCTRIVVYDYNKGSVLQKAVSAVQVACLASRNETDSTVVSFSIFYIYEIKCISGITVE